MIPLREDGENAIVNITTYKTVVVGSSTDDTRYAMVTRHKATVGVIVQTQFTL